MFLRITSTGTPPTSRRRRSIVALRLDALEYPGRERIVPKHPLDGVADFPFLEPVAPPVRLLHAANGAVERKRLRLPFAGFRGGPDLGVASILRSRIPRPGGGGPGGSGPGPGPGSPHGLGGGRRRPGAIVRRRRLADPRRRRRQVSQIVEQRPQRPAVDPRRIVRPGLRTDDPFRQGGDFGQVRRVVHRRLLALQDEGVQELRHALVVPGVRRRLVHDEPPHVVLDRLRHRNAALADPGRQGGDRLLHPAVGDELHEGALVERGNRLALLRPDIRIEQMPHGRLVHLHVQEHQEKNNTKSNNYTILPMRW